jgi:hypothetical protein
MRALFVVGLGCLWTGVEAADRPLTVQIASLHSLESNQAPASATTPPSCTPPSAPDVAGLQTKPTTEISELLDCIGKHVNEASPPKGFKCKLMAFTPSLAPDAFGYQSWYPINKTDMTPEIWAVVNAATKNAMDPAKPSSGPWDSPAVGIEAKKLPSCSVHWPKGDYVILLFFDTQSLQVWRDRKPAGKCTINDNAPWRDILWNAGIFLAPKSS